MGDPQLPIQPPPPPTPVAVPTPIEHFTNPKLKESIRTALEGIGDDKMNAVLTVNNNGLGVMVVRRFDWLGGDWAMVAAARYNRTSGGEVEAIVQGSW